MLSTKDAIAALATPWGESAIAVIRLSGTDCLDLLQKMFSNKKRLSGSSGFRMYYGYFIDPVTEESIDEVMISVYKCPRSYTGEDSAEIFCHGSPAIIDRILYVLFKNGFRSAQPGEFTQRAFINGRMDLTRAEAVNEIIRSKSDRARALALNRLSGAIENRINAIKDKILSLLAAVEIRLDYPDDEIDEEANYYHELDLILPDLMSLSASYKTGKIIQEGVTVVIAGATNAGKSALFNLLLREDRSIVSDFHGTTRDYIEGSIIVSGIPIKLYDTAGLRETIDPVEAEGIRRTDKMIAGAHLILFIIDSNTGLSIHDINFLDRQDTGIPVLKIWNKIDTNSNPIPDGCIAISAQTGDGLPDLNKQIAAALIDEGSIETGEPVIDSIRQKTLIDQCLVSLCAFKKGLDDGLSLDLLAADLKAALDALCEITGQVSAADVLNVMFSKFCVGK